MYILPPKSHYISFSFGHLETIEKRERMDGDFLNTEKKISIFELKQIRVDRAWERSGTTRFVAVVLLLYNI